MSDQKKKKLRPESQMMSFGYNPFWSEGAIKAPIFQTSTFEFASAEDGKEFFSKAYGKIEMGEKAMGLIYSRINNPNVEIFENRLGLWEKAEDCAGFASGMAAITTSLLTFTKPGDVILSSLPVYGGTNFVMENILPKYNISVHYILPGKSKQEIISELKEKSILDKVSIIYAESPANPTMQLVDLDMYDELKSEISTGEKEIVFMVDNTFMGPLWQKPMTHGADVVLYSATKYIGGHSDLIAGAALGKSEFIKPIKAHRTFFGNMTSPHTSWLLARSLETLQVRMEKQAQNAQIVAEYLGRHPKVEKVYYLGKLPTAEDQEIFNRHFESAGSMISFDIKGGQKEAFAFLDSLQLIKLAVSLGGTESLAEHPKTMTHTEMPEHLKKLVGVTDQLIRLSIGIENPQDLIEDLADAFAKV